MKVNYNFYIHDLITPDGAKATVYLAAESVAVDQLVTNIDPINRIIIINFSATPGDNVVVQIPFTSKGSGFKAFLKEKGRDNVNEPTIEVSVDEHMLILEFVVPKMTEERRSVFIED